MIEIISTRFQEHIDFDNDIAGFVEYEHINFDNDIAVVQTIYLHNGRKYWVETYMMREVYEYYRDGKLDFNAYIMGEIENHGKDG